MCEEGKRRRHLIRVSVGARVGRDRSIGRGPHRQACTHERTRVRDASSANVRSCRVVVAVGHARTVQPAQRAEHLQPQERLEHPVAGAGRVGDGRGDATKGQGAEQVCRELALRVDAGGAEGAVDLAVPGGDDRAELDDHAEAEGGVERGLRARQREAGAAWQRTW